MKKIILLLLIILSFSSFIKAQSTERTIYTFIINDQTFTASERVLNVTFGECFEQLLKFRLAKRNDFTLWRETYDIWLDNARRGTYKWRVFGSIANDLQYTGPNAQFADLGVAQNGKDTSKDNPNKPKNTARRMSMLNTLMMKYITNGLTNYNVD